MGWKSDMEFYATMSAAAEAERSRKLLQRSERVRRAVAVGMPEADAWRRVDTEDAVARERAKSRGWNAVWIVVGVIALITVLGLL